VTDQVDVVGQSELCLRRWGYLLVPVVLRERALHPETDSLVQRATGGGQLVGPRSIPEAAEIERGGRVVCDLILVRRAPLLPLQITSEIERRLVTIRSRERGTAWPVVTHECTVRKS
jgi:hypothetical protein